MEKMKKDIYYVCIAIAYKLVQISTWNIFDHLSTHMEVKNVMNEFINICNCPIVHTHNHWTKSDKVLCSKTRNQSEKKFLYVCLSLGMEISKGKFGVTSS